LSVINIMVSRPPKAPPLVRKDLSGNNNARWVLDAGQNLAPGQVNYDDYAHPVALPGPVLSSKTGKEYMPNIADLGKKKKMHSQIGSAASGRGMRRQNSQGVPSSQR